MATPEPSRPRAVETPLPFAQANAPHADVELGVTTTDDGEWGQPAPVPERALSNGAFAGILTAAGLLRLRTLYLQHRARRRS